jgi:hypothetical protein
MKSNSSTKEVAFNRNVKVYKYIYDEDDYKINDTDSLDIKEQQYNNLEMNKTDKIITNDEEIQQIETMLDPKLIYCSMFWIVLFSLFYFMFHPCLYLQ